MTDRQARILKVLSAMQELAECEPELYFTSCHCENSDTVSFTYLEDLEYTSVTLPLIFHRI